MKHNNILILILSLLIVSSCNRNNNDNYIELFGKNIKLYGNPEQKVISQYVNGDVDFVYPFNTMVSMSVILEVPAIYHCFILEQVGENKQLSYIKIDDGMNFNYIPNYDSLEYDLNISIKDEYNGVMSSSKFDSIPFIRNKSEKYNQLISQNNDAKELSDFYNNSLFFQCDTNIIKQEYKRLFLNQLIKIMLVRYVESVGDENVLYSPKVFSIFHEPWSSSLDCGILLNKEEFDCHLSYIKKLSNDFNKNVLNFHLRSNKNEKYVESVKYYNYYSIHLSIFWNILIYDIKNKIFDIYKLYDDGYIIYYYNNFFFFAFNTQFENNKLSIERNFINHNFLLPPKFINYQ